MAKYEPYDSFRYRVDFVMTKVSLTIYDGSIKSENKSRAFFKLMK